MDGSISRRHLLALVPAVLSLGWTRGLHAALTGTILVCRCEALPGSESQFALEQRELAHLRELTEMEEAMSSEAALLSKRVTKGHGFVEWTYLFRDHSSYLKWGEAYTRHHGSDFDRLSKEYRISWKVYPAR